MTLSSITLSSLTATSATSQVSATQTSPPAGASDTGGTDRTRLSRMGELMSRLQDLENTDPDQAKQVLSNIASKLADKASSSSDPHLQQLADKFAQAAKTGDLSGLKPQGHPHPHHHHDHASGGGAASSSDATAAAAAVSGKAASYTQNGSDPMAEVESILSDALNGVSA